MKIINKAEKKWAKRIRNEVRKLFIKHGAKGRKPADIVESAKAMKLTVDVEFEMVKVVFIVKKDGDEIDKKQMTWRVEEERTS